MKNNFCKETPNSILLLEDDANTGRNIKELLEEEGFQVLYCMNLYKASELWEGKKQNILHIVTDLSMDPNGLNEIEKRKSVGGLYSGWLWLWNNVAEDRLSNKYPIKHIIFLTEYHQNLRKYIAESTEDEHAFFTKYVNFISKGDPDDAEKQLIELLKK